MDIMRTPRCTACNPNICLIQIDFERYCWGRYVILARDILETPRPEKRICGSEILRDQIQYIWTILIHTHNTLQIWTILIPLSNNPPIIANWYRKSLVCEIAWRFCYSGHVLSGELMAQFTADVRLKPLVTGNGLSVGSGAFHCRCRVMCFGGGVFSFSLSGDRKRKLCVPTAHSSKSSPPASSASSNAGGVFDEVLEDETGFEIDELAGFRGLVLDISYRSACNFQVNTHFTLTLLIIELLIYIESSFWLISLL